MTTSNALETMWDDPTDIITTLDAAVEALKTAHGDTGRCCPVCPACATFKALVVQMMPAIARQSAENARQSAENARRWQDHDLWLQNLRQQEQELTQRITALEVVQEQYDALYTAHEALQLEHTDLQAAYYVTERALRRAQKDHGADAHG